jgi:N,N'-diacetyllegionaminate synthase
MNFKYIKKTQTPYIIAEIGLNHDGNANKAFSLIKSAKRAGAHAAKFQLFKAGDLYLEKSKIYKNVKKLELTYDKIHKLRKFCKKIDIDFICTPFSVEAAKFLKKIKVDAIKIASMDANNFLLLSHCIDTKIPLIISTGMCNYSDLLKIKKFTNKKKNISILHCISNYPSSLKDLNLKLISKLKKIFGKNYLVGYSDHSIGITACITALFNQALIIEKHFTLKKSNKGDHLHSSDETELKYLSSFAKNFKLITFNESALFNKRKDLKNKKNFRRGVYASQDLKKYEVLNKDKLKTVRPDVSLGLILDENLYNKKVTKILKADERITSKNTNSN